MKQIAAYWWRGEKYPNLGDEITQILVERCFGVEAVKTSQVTADLFSTGSILGWIRPPDKPAPPKIQHVVGSGYMGPRSPISDRENLVVHSVRGYLTKQLMPWLSMNSVTVGDPGLLVENFARITGSATKNSIGVILHHSRMGDPDVTAKFAHLPVTFLDIRTRDSDSFVSEMATCDFILSESLHGLIFADALGIPNVWMTLGRKEGPADFKYFDYFSSVGRDFQQRIVGIPASFLMVKRLASVAPGARNPSLQADIFNAFEAALSQSVDSSISLAAR